MKNKIKHQNDFISLKNLDCEKNIKNLLNDRSIAGVTAAKKTYMGRPPRPPEYFLV